MLLDSAVFSSVFPPAAALGHTTPTPVATPDVAFTAAGQSFGTLASPSSHRRSHSLSAAQLQVKRNIAWSAATRFLSLANLTGDELKAAYKHGKLHRSKSSEVEEAIDFLLSGNGPDAEADVDWNLVSSIRWELHASKTSADRVRSNGIPLKSELIFSNTLLLQCRKPGHR
jgi:anaphase-promoting complex subunit 2